MSSCHVPLAAVVLESLQVCITMGKAEGFVGMAAVADEQNCFVELPEDKTKEYNMKDTCVETSCGNKTLQHTLLFDT